MGNIPIAGGGGGSSPAISTWVFAPTSGTTGAYAGTPTLTDGTAISGTLLGSPQNGQVMIVIPDVTNTVGVSFTIDGITAKNAFWGTPGTRVFAAGTFIAHVPYTFMWDSVAGTWCQTSGPGAAAVTSPYVTVDGSVFGPAFALTAPPASGWSWVNQGGSSVASVNNSLGFLFTSNSGNDQIRAYVRSLPASTGYTATIGIISPCKAVGMAISDGTKFIFAWMNLSTEVLCYEFSNSTSVGSQYFDVVSLQMTQGIQWFRWVDAGGARKFQISPDGNVWLTLNSQASATFLTETKFGVAYETNQSNSGVLSLIHVASSTP